jgi:hypothetical protein
VKEYLIQNHFLNYILNLEIVKNTALNDTGEVSMNTALQQRYKRHLDMMRGTAPDLSRDFSNINIKPALKIDTNKVR